MHLIKAPNLHCIISQPVNNFSNKMKLLFILKPFGTYLYNEI